MMTKLLARRIEDLEVLCVNPTQDKHYNQGARKNFEERWLNPIQNNAKYDDFEIAKVFGEGGFGRVALVKHKGTGSIYAMKSMIKEGIVRKKVIESVLSEKRIIQAVNFPFIVRFFYSFKDHVYLYLVLEFIPGGDLYYHLSRLGKFEEKIAKFYAAQIIMAFDYLHNLDIVYRDLKPENVLLAANGYIKVTDLGFAKIVKSRTYTFCGTPFYLAPEIISNKGYGTSVDWWTLGILIFELDSGKPPFDAQEDIKIFEKIMHGQPVEDGPILDGLQTNLVKNLRERGDQKLTIQYKSPSHFSKDLKDLCSHLIQPDLSRRYGNLKGGTTDIMRHSWFQTIQWEAVYEQSIRPSYLPALKGIDDTSNFDPIKDSMPKRTPKNSFSEQFKDF